MGIKQVLLKMTKVCCTNTFVYLDIQFECHISSHLYHLHGNTISGDLSIIPNFKLRDLIAKDPEDREHSKVERDKILSLLCEAVDQYEFAVG